MAIIIGNFIKNYEQIKSMSCPICKTTIKKEYCKHVNSIIQEGEIVYITEKAKNDIKSSSIETLKRTWKENEESLKNIFKNEENYIESFLEEEEDNIEIEKLNNNLYICVESENQGLMHDWGWIEIAFKCNKEEKEKLTNLREQEIEKILFNEDNI